MKRCTKCREEKALSGFGAYTRNKDGRESWCKRCKVDAARARRLRDPARYSKDARRYFMLSRYGLTAADYFRLLEDQGFCCASCGDELDLGKDTHVDHCHTTGSVRAVLCKGCNLALGFLKDDPDRIEALVGYARRHAP